MQEVLGEMKQDRKGGGGPGSGGGGGGKKGNTPASKIDHVQKRIDGKKAAVQKHVDNAMGGGAGGGPNS